MEYKYTYKGYVYVIKRYTDKALELGFIPHMKTYDRYSVHVYKPTTVETKSLFFKKTKEIETVVYESSGHLKADMAEMIGRAVIDVLSCHDVISLNHLLRNDWGYKAYNDFLDWRKNYPDFYDDNFEPFFTQYKKVGHFNMGDAIKE